MFKSSTSWPKIQYNTNCWEFYTSSHSCAFLDIETTGLSSAHHAVILNGLGIPQGDSLAVTQYFAQNLSEERDVLEHVFVELCHNPFLITYNGNAFDLPFLEKRIQKYGISSRLPLHQSFDLYQIIRRFFPAAKLLPNLKQKTIEDFLGLASNRTDEISGQESVALYQQYVSQPSASLRELILLHNRDDVLQLSQLLRILDKLDLHKIMFHVGLMVTHQNKKILLHTIQITKKGIRVMGNGSGISLDYESYTLAYEVTYDAKTEAFSLWIPSQQEQDCSFIDLEAFSFDFSPLEKYSNYESGFLLYESQHQLAYCELNHMLMILVTAILKLL